jgi:hypothetical protein
VLRPLRQTPAVLFAGARLGVADADAFDGTRTGFDVEEPTGTGPSVSVVPYDTAPACARIADDPGNAARCGTRGVLHLVASCAAAIIPNVNGAAMVSFRAKALRAGGDRPRAGGTTNSVGALQLGNGRNMGLIPGGVSGDCSIAIDRSDACVLGGAISDTCRAILHATETNHG